MTGQWRLLTSRDMLEAERATPRVERAVREFQDWADERAQRQREALLADLKEKLR